MSQQQHPSLLFNIKTTHSATVTSGDATSDTALAGTYMCADSRPVDFDRSSLSLAEIPSGLLATFDKAPLVGPQAFSQLVRCRQQRMAMGEPTYGLMASEVRGRSEFSDDEKKMLEEFRFLQNLGYEWLCLRSPRSGVRHNFWGRRGEQWLDLLSGMDSEENVNLVVGGNGRVPGAAKANSLVIIGFLWGTPTEAGKSGIVTKYKQKKAAKAAMVTPAQVLPPLISVLIFCI